MSDPAQNLVRRQVSADQADILIIPRRAEPRKGLGAMAYAPFSSFASISSFSRLYNP
jgi:hypothetical protein